MSARDVIKKTEAKMKKSIESFQHEIASVRTGKATTALLDTVKVDAYGQTMPLKQVGNVAVQDAHTLMVQVWDKSMVSSVEKAIRDSNLGLNPAAEGQSIRVTIPPLTEERRKEYVKLTRKYSEETKVALRNLRREIMHGLDKLEKDKEISEDEKNRGKKDADDLVHKYENKVNDLVAVKEKEIMEV
ncbi:ribosome recycling factor [Prosthecochloris sp. N3]|uniref:Ribosome-recycling factor n=1 Tax=Prosthecochloris ethylica TaxID=2743976 RepID=A0ABR9XNH4_9CHLB|nr:MULTISPECIES: ribosome recycling factor [Prosthecochloris]MEC9487354.1 ribosome recycling factor [Prosthecochloris sp.]MBF0585686.1 ribosome recycling factor [Prosthecochloris ethylica]MBF0635596.1 ribosome recycling factor [Prosthecochloris ethylica]NUK46895.1 ribosome recycling factor [Prosthecochloris ethylica]RNA65394.1 ribosome recycling factor [Prosthecochloris sp. ZM_2]